MAFRKRLSSSYNSDNTSLKGVKSKKHSKGFKKKFVGGLKKTGKFTKKSIGSLGRYGQKSLDKVMSPLNNLTSSPITLILLVGVGGFIAIQFLKK